MSPTWNFSKVLPWLFHVGPGCCQSFVCKCSQCLQRQLCLQATRVYSAAPKIPFVTQPVPTLQRTQNISQTLSSQDRYNAHSHSEQTFWLQSWWILSSWLLHGAQEQRLQSKTGPRSSSSLDQLNDTRKSKAGGSKANLDWILQQAPGRQTASTQGSPTSQRCPCCAQSKTKTLALIYKSLSETWGY